MNDSEEEVKFFNKAIREKKNPPKKKVYTVIVEDDCGNQKTFHFEFKNNVNAHPLQLHPTINNIEDLYRMTVKEQERWKPSWISHPNIGIDIEQNIKNNPNLSNEQESIRHRASGDQ